MSNPRFVGLKAMADGSLLRTATLHDKPYIVVPIVSAVGDKVWRPANSPVPELVPAEVLEAGYWSRNNRPIVAGHPRVNGEYVSANSPEILETYAYGHLFAAEFDDKRVKVEAWFDKERANEVGPAAMDVISRLEAGEQIEVSEGNMVVSIDEEGELDGNKYKSKWLSAICDHLATVSEGACNNEMGCGGPRVNERLLVASSGEAKMKDSDKKSGMLKRMLASMTDALKAAMSNNELRMKLFKAVSEREVGVDLVYDENVETKTFIYRICVRYGDYWETYEYDYRFYRRSFEIDGNNVTISDDAAEVEWFEGWRDKTITATTTEPELTASEVESKVSETCSCHKEKEEVQVNANEKKALITRLIGAAKSPFEESDRGMLEGMKDEKLTSLMSAYEGETTTTTAVVESTPTTTSQSVQTTETQPQVAPDQVVISKEEYSDIKAAASAYRQQQEQYRSTLITSLKGAQSAFTEDDLKTFTTSHLEKLAASLNVNEPATVDYSVRGRVESRVASAPQMRELPNPWGLGDTN